MLCINPIWFCFWIALAFFVGAIGIFIVMLEYDVPSS